MGNGKKRRQARAELCQAHISLTLSAMGGTGPSIAWGGQFDPHFLTAPWGLFGRNSVNFNPYTV